MHFIADMWECCLAFNTLGQLGVTEPISHESSWKRGEHFHVMW
jgi:hypothetical protein